VTVPRKVFGVGLNKTGTTTLGAAALVAGNCRIGRTRPMQQAQ